METACTICERNDAWPHGLKVVLFLDGQHAEINPTHRHSQPSNLGLEYFDGGYRTSRGRRLAPSRIIKPRKRPRT
jgi:hypothetical protein